jgi:hypothetical protein
VRSLSRGTYATIVTPLRGDDQLEHFVVAVDEGEEADTRQRKFLFVATVDSQIATRD